MAADPEPGHAIGHVNTKGAVAQTDPNRPELFDLLEVQGRMFGVLLKQGKVGISQLLDDGRQPVVALPESRRGVVVQSGLH